jgi:hypothetical protein
MVQPTDEQALAVEKFKTGRPLKITAFAGTGKTSTLIQMARTRRSRGLYLAFNKAIALEAKDKFPATVECRTIHSLAFGAVARSYRSTDKLADTLYPQTLAQSARKPLRDFGPTLSLNSIQQAHLLLATIKRFCQSMDPEIGTGHVPQIGRLQAQDGPTLGEVRTWAVKAAKAIWARMTDRNDELPMGHDGYLKLWAMKQPKLNVEYVLLDEAQDTNQVVLGLLQKQPCQIVYVGDRYQQIYEWRGAVNAMEQLVGCDEASLTQSFRFGAPIAGAASLVLNMLGEKQTLRGNPEVDSSVVIESTPTRAILARTNAALIVELLGAVRGRQRPFIVGGTGELARLLSDAGELKKGNPSTSPELFGFRNWREVADFADTDEGESLRTFVQLVQQHDERTLLDVVQNTHGNESTAQLILSTAHKAKGREWESVRLARDFAKAGANGKWAFNEAESRLFYVAMTRARRYLAVDAEQLTHFTVKPGDGSTRKWVWKRARHK